MSQEVAFFRYRQKFHLSYEQAMNEPIEEIERAFLIWEEDAKRVKLEEDRKANN